MLRDWQADKSAKVVTVSITVSNFRKRAKAVAANALAAAVAITAPAAAIIPTYPTSNCSSWLFIGKCKYQSAGTCNKDLYGNIRFFMLHC